MHIKEQCGGQEYDTSFTCILGYQIYLALYEVCFMEELYLAGHYF